MSKIYILFTRNYPKDDGNYTYLPQFEVHSKKPKTKGIKDKVVELGVGECVDTFRCTLSGPISYGSGSYEDAENDPYVTCELYRVSNIDGVAKEELTETFILAHDSR